MRLNGFTAKTLRASIPSLYLFRYISSSISGSLPPASIVNKALWQTTPYINGAFRDVAPGGHNEGTTFNVKNPANGQVIATLPRNTAKDVELGAKVAMDSWKAFKLTTAFERSKLLRKMSHLMDHYQDDLAMILTLEAGKPLAEARGEIAYARSFYDIYAEEATRANGNLLQPNLRGRRIITSKQPVGPAALITPWNFPSAMITRKVGPAIAAGCTVLIKPSEETPLSALALCAIAHEAGVPAGVINCLTVGREEVTEVGMALCHNPLLRKLSFTGSTKVGQWLMKESASTLKRISLELGGNAPFIVFDDADLHVALNALMNSKFRNAGQTCISSNRILVQEGVYEKFAKMVSEKVAELVCGNGLDKGVTLGPLINDQGLLKVKRQVDDCISKGAIATTGGAVNSDLNAMGGTFFQPTVLTGVTPDMVPCHEETFGPIAPLIMFKTEREAIDLANDTEYGLAGYACTRDLARAWRVAERLEFGLVGINEGSISAPHTPFGGMKMSGLGKEGGSWGLDEYLEVKYICMGMGQDF